MLFEIGELIRQKPGSAREVEVVEDLADASWEEGKFIEPVRGQATIIRTEEGILVKFTVGTVLELICDRCLKKFPKKIKVAFEQEYLLTSLPAKTITQKEEENEGFVVDLKGRVSFREALRQGILVALTIKKICRKNCPGIRYEA